MSKNHKICIISNSEEFFFNELNQVLKKSEFSLSETLKMYVVRLLCDNLLQNNEIDLDTPLAIQFLESLQENSTVNQRKLKAIADYTLYISGYFAESLNNKIIDVDYYNKIGKKAYAELFNQMGDSGVIYYLLYSKYYNITEALTELSFKTMHTGCKNLIKLYDRWLATGSNVLEKKLNEKGIITDDKKPKVA